MRLIPVLLSWCLLSGALAAETPDYPIQSVPFHQVQVEDAFWGPRLASNQLVTIEHNLRELEKQGSLGGFKILAGRDSGTYHGYMWGDSDVYKTLEGIAYCLKAHPDAALAQRVNGLVADIVAAQAPDGYLQPHIQLVEPGYRHFTDEGTRTCELYDLGHLIESAVACSELAGGKSYLDTARKAADLITREYAPGRLENPSGHPEIELALARLYRATGNRTYLETAAALVERAWQKTTLWSNGRPALGHDEAWGHAVAMLYLYSGATEVAVLTGNDALRSLLLRKWENLAGRKLYLTGGVGHGAFHEGFAPDYVLPSDKAYCETCAAIALVFWNYRLFRATGDARHLDVLERTLYNGFLAGVSLSGDRFFYPNPLASRGNYQRTPWFGCPCCPVNVIRFLPTVPGMIYATRGGTLLVNLFVGGTGRLKIAGEEVEIRQQTRYPWDGRVALTLNPRHPLDFALNVRIPGWVRSQPVPSDLYRYTNGASPQVSVQVNGQSVDWTLSQGFASLRRTWQPGDLVTIELPMPVRKVVAHPKVEDLQGQFAIERGPLVYCLEGVDNGGQVINRTVGADATLEADWWPAVLGGITGVKIKSPDGVLQAVPYYAWAHRGTNEMTVWIHNK